MFIVIAAVLLCIGASAAVLYFLRKRNFSMVSAAHRRTIFANVNKSKHFSVNSLLIVVAAVAIALSAVVLAGSGISKAMADNQQLGTPVIKA